MPTIPPTLNGLRAISVRVVIPWRGVWFADVELDVDIVETVAGILSAPTPAALVVGGQALTGTIDPRASGVFGDRAHARVVGGRNGWDKEVPAQHFTNPAGAIPSTLVYAATAAAVLEAPPLDPLPVNFGVHYVRGKGPASRVFGDRDWFVNLTTGVAVVSEWPPLPPDPTWVIQDFDIGDRRILITSDSLILPGTVIADPRFGAKTFIARDVEQTFDKNGSKAEIWTAEKPVSRLAEGFANFIREVAHTGYLKTYKYRFVLPGGPPGKVILQAITEGAPDLNPIEQWTGLAGISASLAGNAALAPSTEIVVGFIGGDPSEPFLVAFSPLNKPLGITLDATTFINVGVPTSPVAKATGVQAQILALQAEIAAIVAALAAQATAGAWLAASATSTMVPALTAAITAASVALAAGAADTPSKKLLTE